jgi:hypothetical protein
MCSEQDPTLSNYSRFRRRRRQKGLFSKTYIALPKETHLYGYKEEASEGKYFSESWKCCIEKLVWRKHLKSNNENREAQGKILGKMNSWDAQDL